MATHSEAIDAYEIGGRHLQNCVRGLLPEDCAVVPPDDVADEVGRWSIQQIAVHVMDADLIFASRMKRVIAEDRPKLEAFDENRFVERLHYELQDAQSVIDLLAVNRQLFTKVLRALPAETFARVGEHAQRGPMTLLQLLELTTSHCNHHAKFIEAKRAWMGKNLW